MSPLRRTILLSFVLLVGLVPATHAHADPSAADIEAQITKIWDQLEPLIEQYNKVHSELLRLQKSAAAVERKIAPLRETVNKSREQVGAMAAQYYKGGRSSAINSLLLSQSPSEFANQLILLDQMARTKQTQITATVAAKAEFEAKKADLDRNIADQKVKDTDLAAKKKVIEAELSRLQKLRIQAYGSGGPGGSLRLGPCPAVMIGGKGGTAASYACKQIGKPYVFNTNGPSTFDCSGLTQSAWAAAGESLTHFTGAQWKESYAVSRANARPGDLAFFYSDRHHVGIYVGNNIVVHAPKPGDFAKMSFIDKMGPFQGFRRPSGV